MRLSPQRRGAVLEARGFWATRKPGFQLQAEYARREHLYSPPGEGEEPPGEQRRLLPVVTGYVIAIIIGLLAGASANMKIHGVLYVLPFAVGLLEQETLSTRRLRLAIVGIVSSLPTMILPFLLPNVALTGRSSP